MYLCHYNQLESSTTSVTMSGASLNDEKCRSNNDGATAMSQRRDDVSGGGTESAEGASVAKGSSILSLPTDE